MPISGWALVKEFEQQGWVKKGQKGSHVKMEKKGRIVIIPLHRELKKGTEQAIRKNLEIKDEVSF
jgi:predicted RNA binding protein YcfA (HicA-like mRNA interferase family)